MAAASPLLSDDDPPVTESPIRVRCSIAVTLDKLDAASAEVLKRWIANPDMSAAAITRKLKEPQIGIELRAANILRHRNKDCKCPQS